MNGEYREKKPLGCKISKQQIFYLLTADIGYALALNLFYVDNKIAAGGLAGLGTVFKTYLGIPVGLAVLAMSIPIVLVAWRVKGGTYTVTALITTLCYSAIVDLLSFLPCISHDRIVAVVCGGILYGFAASMTIKAHLSSGGTDLVAKILITRFKNISIGALLMIIDGSIVLIAMIAYRDVGLGIYALLAIAVCSVITDLMNRGFNKAQMFFIFANQNVDKIVDSVLYDMHRGVTSIDGTGKYSGEHREILLVAVHPNETPMLKSIVHTYDPSAFIALVTANGIIGKGFEDTNLTATVHD